MINIIDERESQKKKDRKEQRGNTNYNEPVRAKWLFLYVKVRFSIINM